MSASARVTRTPKGAVAVTIVNPEASDPEQRLIVVTLPPDAARRLAVHLLELLGEPR